MTEPQNMPPKLQEQLRHDRALIANELPELTERHDRMVEAKSEDTFCGHLRQAIHRSGRLVREIAADAGVSSQTLCEFLDGTRTLRSDVLDRLAQLCTQRSASSRDGLNASPQGSTRRVEQRASRRPRVSRRGILVVPVASNRS